MKPVIFLMVLLAAALNAFSQKDSLIKLQTTKTKLAPASTADKPATLIPAGKNTPVPKLPDLKFTALTVVPGPAHLVNGVTTYNLDVSYTVKNDGTAPAPIDKISVQTWLTDADWIKHDQDPSFTNHFTVAGGWGLGDGTDSGTNLEAGASRQISYTIYNKALITSPKPVLFLVINYRRDEVKEITKDNNSAYVTILL